MTQKKILIINGHPDKESYNFALAAAYKKGVENTQAQLEEINIRELSFNPNLQFGYRKRTELEPDLLHAQELIKWADHLVWIYPVWWGSVPAIMKGFIDRVFLPGFAFQKKEDSVWWDKYLTGRTARLICTLDQPSWYYKWVYGNPSHKAMKKLTMNFVGIKKVSVTTIGPIRMSKVEYREKWLTKMETLGKRNG
jgi:putative NADPH-quinone reductase